MKDIKLTIEEIKKIFECFEVEGYELSVVSGNTWFTVGQKTFCLEKMSNFFRETEYNIVYYPLFLQRVIEGINKDNRFVIEQRKRDYVAGANGKFEYQSNKTIVDIDNENVIKYILDKL